MIGMITPTQNLDRNSMAGQWVQSRPSHGFLSRSAVFPSEEASAQKGQDQTRFNHGQAAVFSVGQPSSPVKKPRRRRDKIRRGAGRLLHTRPRQSDHFLAQTKNNAPKHRGYRVKALPLLLVLPFLSSPDLPPRIPLFSFTPSPNPNPLGTAAGEGSSARVAAAMDAARRERRHHRKAGAAAAAAAGVAPGGTGGAVGAAAAARAAYGDVFGGPPRFATPFGAAPVDYAEVFGGAAAACSIPFLDLPPAGGDGAFLACKGKGDYGEIFSRFDFADFARPYEELFGAPEPEPERDPEVEEIASSNGSSRFLHPISLPCFCLDATVLFPFRMVEITGMRRTISSPFTVARPCLAVDVWRISILLLPFIVRTRNKGASLILSFLTCTLSLARIPQFEGPRSRVYSSIKHLRHNFGLY
jgi:hypothetical protein